MCLSCLQDVRYRTLRAAPRKLVIGVRLGLWSSKASSPSASRPATSRARASPGWRSRTLLVESSSRPTSLFRARAHRPRTNRQLAACGARWAQLEERDVRSLLQVWSGEWGFRPGPTPGAPGSLWDPRWLGGFLFCGSPRPWAWV